MSKTAILLTDNQLTTSHGKTAHGMILGASRFTILAVVDSASFGKDAGSVIDGKHRNIPVFKNVDEALTALPIRPDYCVVGAASHGGVMSDGLVSELKAAIINNISVVNGLHELVRTHPKLIGALKEHPVEVIDIRQPKSAKECHMWEGKIAELTIPRIAVLGTDCAIGKRTTCYMLLQLCKANGINAEMIYTGQTGWMHGLEYGFIFDSTLNDFVSGELEYWVMKCAKERKPDLILLEGQASLRNPAGPCGAELLLSAGAQYVILQHIPGRKIFSTDSQKKHHIPGLRSEIELISYYGAQVIAVTLNPSNMDAQSEREMHDELRGLTLPIINPRQEGVESLLPLINNIVQKSKDKAHTQVT